MNARRLAPLAALPLLLVASSAAANPPLFDSAESILSLSAAPRQIVIADLDGDGDDDLVICGDGGLSWAENAGDAVYVEHAITAQKPLGACSAVVAAHFDQDGAIDLAFTGPSEAGVVYRNPAIELWTLVHLADGYVGGARVAAYDVRHDAGPELFTLVESPDLIDFHDNDGTRGWTKTTTDAVTKVVNVPALVVVDENGDGVPEVLTLSVIGLSVSDYRKTGSGWLSRGIAASFLLSDLASGDLDGDGDPDLALIGVDGVGWSENVGGAFADNTASLGSVSSMVMALADLDQDGAADIIHFDADGHLQMLARHAGTWQARDLGAPLTASPVDVIASDIDIDGDLDVIVAGPDALYLHRNITVHTSAYTQRTIDLPGTWAAPDFVVAGDFDRDGDQDLAVSSNTNQNTRLMTWQAGTWTQAGVLSATRLHGEGAAVDFDGDGDLDIVAASATAIVFLRNGGALPWATANTLTTEFTNGADLAVGDVDNDGDPDVVAGSRATGQIGWIENLAWGADQASHVIDTSWPGFDELALVDVDHDGNLDVVVAQAGATTHEVAWYRNAPGMGWDRYPIATLTGPIALTAGDIDRDGVVEVLATTAVDSMKVYAPLTYPSLEWGVTISAIVGARIALGVPADIDLDGDLDWTAPYATFMSWYGLEGDTLREGLVGVGQQVKASALADLDHDGDLDLVGAVQGENRVALWFDDRYSAALDATSLTQNLITRAAPNQRYHPFQLFLEDRARADDLDLELSSCGFTATIGGAPAAAADLVRWLDIGLHIDLDEDLVLDADEPALPSHGAVVDGKFRVVLDADALTLASGDAPIVLVSVTLDPSAFVARPPAELVITWAADCEVVTRGYPDGTITHVGRQGSVLARFGVGNRLLQPAGLSAEVASGGTVTWNPLTGSTDPDNDPISLVGVVAPASHGTVVVNADHTLTYVSAGDGATSDAFVYALTDGISEVWALASVTIAVPPQAPVAFDMAVTSIEDTALTLTLDGGDADDAATFAIATQPTHGSIELVDATTGQVIYTPDANYVGADSFTFTVSGGGETSAMATVAITVDASAYDDDDGDGLPDWYDDCANVANADQADLDQDGVGDACDTDVDGDAVPNGADVCPRVADAVQADHDDDEIGDACDDDDDNDGVDDRMDGCPRDADAEQDDLDGDGWGDVHDPDDDDDGLADDDDNCPRAANRSQANHDADAQGDACDDDDDGDDVPDAIDDCPLTPDPDQLDGDLDGLGDACDEDRDEDGAPNDLDCDDDDASASFPRTFYADPDDDGVGTSDDTKEACAETPPAGYSARSGDNCPTVANMDQADTDGDGVGDACEGLRNKSLPSDPAAADPEADDANHAGCGASTSLARDGWWLILVMALALVGSRRRRQDDQGRLITARGSRRGG